MSIAYQLIRSRRRTIGLEIRPDGSLVVRAPLRASRVDIDRLVSQKSRWIEARIAEVKKRPPRPEINFAPPQVRQQRRHAHRVIEERVEWYCELIGVKYNRVKVTSAKRRWGSCTSKGTLNFTWRLILVPPLVMDYVVVHELTHLLEMNHSSRFWEKVAQVMPDYRTHKKWLRENQHLLEV